MTRQSALRLAIIVCMILAAGLSIEYLVIGPLNKNMYEPNELLLIKWKIWIVVALGFIAVFVLSEIFSKGNNQEKKSALLDVDDSNDGSIKGISDVTEFGGDFDHLSIFENFNLGVLCVDNEGKILKTNAEFCRKTGFTEHDLIGNKAIDILGEKDMSESDSIRNRKAGKAEIYEHSIRHKDGKHGRYYTAGMPLFDRFKKATGSIGVILDVSDLHEYQEQLKRSLEIEKELSESKSQFVATASHQFRTPLSIIQANAELMYMLLKNSNDKESEKFSIYTERIKREIAHMTGIMEEVLILEKITTGKLKLNRAKIFLDELFVEIKENLLAEDNRTIEIKTKGKKEKVNVDVKLIHEAIINLVTNALKYSSGTNPIAELDYHKEGLTIRISDKGVGIPQKEIQKLFEPFFRASNVSKVPGTGLGLKISKEYVELHGGELIIESEENKGTTAIINLPYGNSE